MRALRFHELGTPDILRLETAPDLKADADHAIVGIRAASINPATW